MFPIALKLGLNFWNFLFVLRTNQALDSATQQERAEPAICQLIVERRERKERTNQGQRTRIKKRQGTKGIRRA